MLDCRIRNTVHDEEATTTRESDATAAGGSDDQEFKLDTRARPNA